MNLPVFEAFSTDDSASIGPRWRKYLARFEVLMTALDLQDNALRKRALLLHYAGEQVYEIFETFSDAQKGGDDEEGYQTLKTSLTTYFEPKKNVDYETFIFRQTKQEKSENVDAFCTRLRKLAATCDFGNVEREIKSQILVGCTSNRLRRRALREDMSLTDLLKHARSLEITEQQAKDIEKGESVNALRHQGYKQQGPQEKKNNDSKCRNCGGTWPHPGGRTSCPAYGKTCTTCSKSHHFWRYCRSGADKKPTQPKSKNSRKQSTRKNHSQVKCAAEVESSDPEDYVFKLNTSGSPKFNILVGRSKQEICFLADSGASVNLISSKTFDNMDPKPRLEKSSSRIFAYGGAQPMKITGKFRTLLQAGDRTCTATIEVVEGAEGPILSWDTCRELRLLTQSALAISAEPAGSGVPCKLLPTKPQEGSVPRNDATNIADEYPQLYEGLGRLEGLHIKLHIDDQVQPVAQGNRRVPFHVRQQVEEQLKKDEELGVIERATGPTPWISPIVVVPKKDPGKIRVCVDMRAANTAIKRERHATPTLDELKTMLTGATVFSKLDLNQGYNQLELEESSRYITTFSTHLGLFRYKRLFFGVNSASEIFQETIRQLLSDIDGSVNLSDDILIFGKTQEEHDEALRKVLQRLLDRKLTLNREKCEYNKPSLEFLGHIFGADGIAPSPDKIKSIVEMPTPKNASEVRSFLGMANFCGSAFIKDYATLTHDLRQLTKKTVPWEWTEKHTKAFTTLKNRLSEACALAFFDPSLPTSIYTDASPVGVSAVLTQGDKVIQYGSRALTPVEQRYSQTEREALAITWACEYFHIFVFGAPFEVFTDHKPLVSIFGNTRAQLSARIERWVLRTLPYEMRVTYRPGHDNPADYLSRHPVDVTPSSREEKAAEEYLNYLVDVSTPKTMTIDQVINETAKDATLQAVIQAMITNNWQPKDDEIDRTAFHVLFTCRNELAVHESGILLKGTRIVLPDSLHADAVRLAHTGHQGIVKTTALLREKVWFKGLQAMVERTVKACHLCQVTTPTAAREPLEMSELPEDVWTEVSSDFGDIPNGQKILVVVDDYSRYPFVEFIDSVTARTVIPRLDSLFAMCGIPGVFKTDNGAPFFGHDFAAFAEHEGFHHRKITPRWPRANAEAERFMRTVKKPLKYAYAKNLNLKQELNKFLLDYRTTPHPTTGVPPATLFFGRKLRTRLPQIITAKPPGDTEVRERDTASKAKMKAYADARVHAKPSTIALGDAVLLKDTSVCKSRTPYQLDPFVVVGKKGSMITASRGDTHVTRNSSFFKRSPCPPAEEPPAEDTLDASTTALQPPMSTSPTPPATPRAVAPPRSISSPARSTSDGPATPRSQATPLPATGRPQRLTNKPEYLKDYVCD